MADLYNSDLGQNTRKAAPSSQFGTRDIKFLSISVDYDLFTDGSGTYDAYLDSDSMYSQIVRNIQKVAEIYVLGAPTQFETSQFVIGIASTTAQWQYSEEGNYDYNEISWDESEPGHTQGGGISQLGWPDRYQSNGDSAVSTVADSLCYFFRDNTNIGNAFSVRVLEDIGFGLMPGTYLI